VVVPAQFIIGAPLAAGFLALFPGLFTVVLKSMLTMSFQPMFGPGLVVFALAFAVILGWLGLKALYEPGLTSYAIYPDRIEFEEGLLNQRRRTVLLDKIIDVQLIEGVLRRTVGAGSITLVSQRLASQGDGRLSNRTLRLSNVPDPGGIYELIRSLALGGQNAESTRPE
jgi:uncharacterized membrane protein YdbT with pleckstrin-like domain